jgi:hypothetical protein
VRRPGRLLTASASVLVVAACNSSEPVSRAGRPAAGEQRVDRDAAAVVALVIGGSFPCPAAPQRDRVNASPFGPLLRLLGVSSDYAMCTDPTSHEP